MATILGPKRQFSRCCGADLVPSFEIDCYECGRCRNIVAQRKGACFIPNGIDALGSAGIWTEIGWPRWVPS